MRRILLSQPFESEKDAVNDLVNVLGEKSAQVDLNEDGTITVLEDWDDEETTIWSIDTYHTDMQGKMIHSISIDC